MVTKMPEPTQLDAGTLLDLGLDGIKLIEASAGTGKTHTIADLYLRQVLAGREPSQILIVTFTNAATEELRGRIHNRLYHVLDCFKNGIAGDDEFLRLLCDRRGRLDEEAQLIQLQRLQYALRAMDEAAISTIHSFCQRALQEHALSGKQFFDTEMLASDDEFWEAAIKDWWRDKTYRLDGATWRLLHDQLPRLEILTRNLLDLRNKPSARLFPQATETFPELLAKPRSIAQSLHQLAPAWRRHKSDIIDILTGTKDLSRRKDLPYKDCNLEVLIGDANDFFEVSDPDMPFENFEFLGSESLYRYSTDSKRGQDQNLRHEFFRSVDPIAIAWEDYKASLVPWLKTDAFRYAAARVRESKRQVPALAFQDQLSLLLEALQSAAGPGLAKSLRQQYPVAMIDEFQDTDDIQFRIFDRVYIGADDGSLTLIGDPKQAIYSFRGGDIFTYMRARRLPGIELFSLKTNWRSEPRLVDAVNTLFKHRKRAFIYADSIGFSGAASVPRNSDLRLSGHGRDNAALTLWQLPQKPNGTNYSRDQTRDMINQAVAAEIAGLLKDKAKIGDRIVKNGDIAVLVRQTSEGNALSKVLHRVGIRTVTISRDSVFASDEAHGLYRFLVAVSQFQDPSLATASLSSSLLGLDYKQIATIVDDDTRWQDWIDKLGSLLQTWELHGFIPMFQSLLRGFDIGASLARQDNSERRITNLLHLAELLQQQSAGMAGVTPLMSWFREQFELSAREEAEMRLEGDEDLVKIVTIHKSKGLQYPIVFAPFLWSCNQESKKEAVYFHDTELSPCIDLGSANFDNNWLLAEKERLAEDMRVLYVAVTRAQSRVYMAWGQAGGVGNNGYASRTALAWLLHSRQQPEDLEREKPDGFPADMDFTADLQSLADEGKGAIGVVALPLESPVPVRGAAEQEPGTPRLAKFRRDKLPAWRVNSFTRLTRGIHQPAQTGSLTSQGDPILDFPAGSHIGLMLHALLENLDFQRDIGEQFNTLVPRFLPAAGIFGETYRQTLVTWLSNIMHTGLDDDGLSLGILGKNQRLDELEFDFALDRLDIDALNRLLQSMTPQPLKAVSSPAFHGLINGVIDLVFEHHGRYYLADYKSNFLGASPEDYRPEQLRQAMLHRRYDLQSLLYTIALHRFLGQRLPEYEYDRHFGGSYYLFLRAMRPEYGKTCGVHFERPAYRDIAALEELFRFTPPESDGA